MRIPLLGSAGYYRTIRRVEQGIESGARSLIASRNCPKRMRTLGETHRLRDCDFAACVSPLLALTGCAPSGNLFHFGEVTRFSSEGLKSADCGKAETGGAPSLGDHKVGNGSSAKATFPCSCPRGQEFVFYRYRPYQSPGCEAVPLAYPLVTMQASQPAGGGWVQFLPLVAILLIFYFLLILPAQRQRKRTQEMLSALKTGDKVITNGGLMGTIVAVKDNVVQLRIADQVKVDVLRSAIAGYQPESEQRS